MVGARSCGRRRKRHASIPRGLLNCDEVYAQAWASPFWLPCFRSIHSAPVSAVRRNVGETASAGDGAEAVSYRARNRRKAASHYPRALPKDCLKLCHLIVISSYARAGVLGVVVEAQGSALGERGSILLCGGRRFGGLSAWTSSEGLCGDSPSRRSLFALLRIAQRGRCNRLTICDTECVGHKVMSSRSSSSVQRDIAASVMEAPSSRNVPPDWCRDLGDPNFSTWNNLAAPFGKWRTGSPKRSAIRISFSTYLRLPAPPDFRLG